MRLENEKKVKKIVRIAVYIICGLIFAAGIAVLVALMIDDPGPFFVAGGMGLTAAAIIGFAHLASWAFRDPK